MTQSPIKITIPEPCHENWDTMLPNEKGRHCLSCQKTVVDFTAMTDAQIIDYFQKYKGSTCGRFTITQLEYNTHPITKVSLKRRWAWVLSTLLLPLSMNAQAPKHREPIKLEQSHKIKKPKPHKPTQNKNTDFRDSQGISSTISVMGKTAFRPKPKSFTKK